jgi:hypothetical protein
MDADNESKKGVNLPSPPFITVSDIPNFRDLGGYAVGKSSVLQSIRRNVIYRCGEPSRVTENGINTLKGLGITHMYDLRSKSEIERNKGADWGGVKEWSGCERVFAPVFLDVDYSPEALALRYKDYASEGTEVILLELLFQLCTRKLAHYLSGRDLPEHMAISWYLHRHPTGRYCHTLQMSRPRL